MLDLFQTPFKGFSSEDFESYTQEKWSSRLYTRARMSVRDKLAGVGREVSSRLEAAGFEFDSETNDPRPSVFNQNRVDAQWLFFGRSEGARKELATIVDQKHSLADNLRDAGHQKQDVVLAVKVHAGGVDVMLCIHRHAWVDARNAAQKLDLEWERERLGRLLAELESATSGLRLVGPLATTPLAELSAVAVQAELRALSESAEWFVVGKSYEADDIDVMTAAFARVVGDTFLALLPLYKFIAWTRDNDHVQLKAALDDNKAFVKRDGVELGAGDEVSVLSGLFSGKRGVVQGVDKKGMVKVSIGKLVVQIKGSALKRA
jgi:hypothetical protein